MAGLVGAACRCGVYSRAMKGGSVESESRILNGGAQFFTNGTIQPQKRDVNVEAFSDSSC